LTFRFVDFLVSLPKHMPTVNPPLVYVLRWWNLHCNGVYVYFV